MAYLLVCFVEYRLRISSNNDKKVPTNKAASIKSPDDQLMSSVYCIAIKGISKMTTKDIKYMMDLDKYIILHTLSSSNDYLRK